MFYSIHHQVNEIAKALEISLYLIYNENEFKIVFLLNEKVSATFHLPHLIFLPLIFSASILAAQAETFNYSRVACLGVVVI